MSFHNSHIEQNDDWNVYVNMIWTELKKTDPNANRKQAKKIAQKNAKQLDIEYDEDYDDNEFNSSETESDEYRSSESCSSQSSEYSEEPIADGHLYGADSDSESDSNSDY